MQGKCLFFSGQDMVSANHTERETHTVWLVATHTHTHTLHDPTQCVCVCCTGRLTEVKHKSVEASLSKTPHPDAPDQLAVALQG